MSGINATIAADNDGRLTYYQKRGFRDCTLTKVVHTCVLVRFVDKIGKRVRRSSALLRVPLCQGMRCIRSAMPCQTDAPFSDKRPVAQFIDAL